MTKVDMKYTSLFWKLGYIEERTDFYHKSYPGGYRIEIEAEKQEIDYGTNVDPAEPAPSRLIEHKDFVILECMNRLLEKGYARERIRIIGDAEKRSSCDIIVSDGRQDPLLAFDCVQWGRPFEDAMECLIENRLPSIGRARASGSRYLCLYTSRLDGGLLDYRSVLLPFTRGGRDATPYFTGVFEDGIGAYLPMPSFSLDERERWLESMAAEGARIEGIDDFRIKEDFLLKYYGSANHLSLPRFIVHIGAGAFWNCTTLASVDIPEGVQTIGGDAFYLCENLRRVNIPPSVVGIGNNPFSGCPNLVITNESPAFVLQNGVLYDSARTKVIHYTPSLPASSFDIPEGTRYIEKHAFYACNNLRRVTVPSSVVCMENNAFSGCKQLVVINHSPYFSIENGVLYNREKMQLYAVIDHSLETLIIPGSVRTIGKNSFWNCEHLRSVVIPRSVTRIGYNPFANCNSLVLENHSPHYAINGGVLFNKEMTELVYCPNTSISRTITIPTSVVKIGRNAFSFCFNLERLTIPEGVIEIGRGAFGSCKNLASISLPGSLRGIGEWAFNYCEKLEAIEIPRTTRIEENTFAHCKVAIKWI